MTRQQSGSRDGPHPNGLKIVPEVKKGPLLPHSKNFETQPNAVAIPVTKLIHLSPVAMYSSINRKPLL